MRMGAPHEGHAVLLAAMAARCAGREHVVLVGSADVAGRADAPLPWRDRVAVLSRLMARRGQGTQGVRCVPLPERATGGWNRAWFEYVLAVCAAHGVGPVTDYVFGADYEAGTFAPLVDLVPGLRLHRVPRALGKSGKEFRRAVVTGDPALRAKYALEWSVYDATELARIGATGLSRPPPTS